MIIYCYFIELKGRDNGAKRMSIVQLVGVTTFQHCLEIAWRYFR